jgi:heme o synthase
VSLLLATVAHLGAVYAVAASLLGAVFLVMAARLWHLKTPKAAIRLFSYSITYLTLLFIFMAVGVFVKH